MEKLEYLTSEVNNYKIHFFSKVVLDKKKIPSDLLIFRLGEGPAILIVHETLKRKIESSGVSGVDFIKLDLS